MSSSSLGVGPKDTTLATATDPLADTAVTAPEITGDWTVDKVVATFPSGAPTTNSSSPVPYFHLLERLKTTKREGWRRFGIQHGESIADHMYRMSLIAMLAPPNIRDKVDLSKCIKMCLIHDMAESLVGDITPVDGVSKPEKNRREAATMEYITGGLLGQVHGGAAGTEIQSIWQEYEDSKTLESQFVHDVDKIELLLQMVEYEKRGKGSLDLGEFTYVATVLTLPESKQWAEELLREREVFWGQRSHIHGESGVDGGLSNTHVQMVNDYYQKPPGPAN